MSSNLKRDLALTIVEDKLKPRPMRNNEKRLLEKVTKVIYHCTTLSAKFYICYDEQANYTFGNTSMTRTYYSNNAKSQDLDISIHQANDARRYF